MKYGKTKQNWVHNIFITEIRNIAYRNGMVETISKTVAI